MTLEPFAGNVGLVNRSSANPSTFSGKKVISVVTSIAIFATGSTYSIDNINDWKCFLQSKTDVEFDTSNLALEPTFSAEIDIRTVVQHLENIRNILSPSMSELAKNLGITRQALYKWLSGENQPDDLSKLKYVEELSKVADAFHAEGITDAKQIIKMKAFEGRSLIDLLKAGDSWIGPVRILINEAHEMEASVAHKSSLKSKGKPDDSWKSSLSIPAVNEE